MNNVIPFKDKPFESAVTRCRCKYRFQAFHPECIQLPNSQGRSDSERESKTTRERESQTELKGEGTGIRGNEGRGKKAKKKRLVC